MRIDKQAVELHYFNSFGVKDRLSTSGLEDNPSLPDFQSFSETKILPTQADHNSIMDNFVILISRVLKKNFPFFSKFGTGVPKHIKHAHYEEMSKKSEVVSTKQLILSCMIM